MTHSKIGTWVAAFFLLAILAGFAASDLRNFGSGKIGFGMGSSTLARIGSQDVTDKEVTEAMERRLQQVRQQNPAADLATIAADFDPVFNSLIDQQTLLAFADKYGFRLSKRLIDAEIAQIPAAKGFDGKFSQQAYDSFLVQQKLTDPEVRKLLTGALLQRMLLIPVVTDPRLAVGMATPYASMLLESRQGQAAAIPIENFRAGLTPSAANLQQYYATHRDRYMVPEQRVLRIARVGPDQVGSITATDQDIATYYNANKAAFAAQDRRSLSQAVVPSQASANAIAAKAKAGTALAAAAGSGGAVSTLAGQSREDYAGVAGAQAAAAVFSATSGAVVGPFKSDFGWVVVKVDSVKAVPGKTLEQARGEIAAKLVPDKRKQAIEAIVDQLQNATDDGANFTEAATQAKLPVTSTPLITAAGTSRADPAFKLPPALAPVVKTAFEIAPHDPPEIIALPGDQGYAMVAPAQVVPTAAAPLASITQLVAKQWINDQARTRAAAAARAIADKVAHGTPLDQALKAAGANLQPPRALSFRRLQIATSKEPVPPPLQMLFTMTEGKSRMLADPKGAGY
ncbi:MAG: peptidyl-prolyl cis-trans isomerase, partial [Sphingomicrobium sp.]